MIEDRCGAGLPGALAARLKGKVVLVGLGNWLLGDDAAGCLVARALRGIPGLDAILAEDIPESYLSAVIQGEPDCVVLVDAIDMAAPAGSVALLEPSDLSLYQPSTHRVPLRLIADFIRRDRAADIVVLAIQPHRLDMETRVSPEVAAAAQLLADMIRHAVARGHATGSAAGTRKREAARC